MMLFYPALSFFLTVSLAQDHNKQWLLFRISVNLIEKFTGTWVGESVAVTRSISWNLTYTEQQMQDISSIDLKKKLSQV